MKKSNVFIFLFAIFLVSSSGNNFYLNCQTQNSVSQFKSFPVPTGSYNIGTQEFYWIDETRSESFTKDPDDKRRLMIQVWYPTDQQPEGEGSLYIKNPNEFTGDELLNTLLQVRTNSIIDAQISDKQYKFPVLVFSHGMQMTRFSNTSQIEHLVSHGYIVFGIDHTMFNRSKKYPDGYLVKKEVEPDFEIIADDPVATAKNQIRYYDELEEQVWFKDAEFVINKIKNLNKEKESQFFNKINLEKFGMFGYSFGGITTLQTCCENLNIKAGVSYDGGKLGSAWRRGISQPFLFVEPIAGEKSREEIEAAGRNYELYLEGNRIFAERDKVFFENAKNENFVLTFTGTEHGHFNDMGMYEKQNKNLLEVDLCHKIINEYTLAFFDKYLREKDPAILNEFPGKYEAAKFEKKINKISEDL